MSIIRTQKDNKFTVIDNQVYADNNLTFEAMGLLGYLLSKPDNWNIFVVQLEAVTNDTRKPAGIKSVRAILNELKDKGYIISQRKPTGHVDYYVYDEPQEIEDSQTAQKAKSRKGKEPKSQRAQKSKSPKGDVLINNNKNKQELIKDKQELIDDGDANALTTSSDVLPEKNDDSKKIKTANTSPAELLKARGVDHQSAKDYIALRKLKKKPLTKNAMADLEQEAKLAGLSIEQVISICLKKSWARFEASWLLNDQRSAYGQAKPHSVKDIPKHTQSGSVRIEDYL